MKKQIGKNVKNKMFLKIALLTLIMCNISKIYGLSEDFLFMINTIGMPRYNAYKEEINEEIYNTYQIFCYSNPTALIGKVGEQIFRESKFGYWTKGGGSYKGSGVRGEYLILGKSYNGSTVHNYCYPLTEIPTTTPETWTYVTNEGAYGSWQDTTKYKYKEQLDFMKNSKLVFNDVLNKPNANNPLYMKEYNITASKIGFTKAKLDSSSTWKTYGVVHALRYLNGRYFHVIFYTPKLAGNADLKTTLEVTEKAILDEDLDEIYIPIKYKTEVINLTGHAKSEHIKEIVANLYINGLKVNMSNGSKITSVGNTYMLVITREKFPQNINYNITVLLDSYIYTEFVADGLIRKKQTKNIQVEVRKKSPIKLNKESLMNLSKKDTWVVSPFAQIHITTKDIIGVTEASKYIAAKLDIDKNSILNKVYVDEQVVSSEILPVKNKEGLIIKIKIPDNTYASIYGINSLRKENRKLF